MLPYLAGEVFDYFEVKEGRGVGATFNASSKQKQPAKRGSEQGLAENHEQTRL